MMKQVLRSMLVLVIVLGATAGSSLAFFTSSVSATNNLITTGTMRLAIDSTSIGGGNSGYVVAYDNGAGVTQLGNFPTITNMLPGETRSIYTTIRNIGTTPFDYRANITGTWGNVTLDGTGYLTVSQVRRFPTGNCFGDVECEDIYYWLTGIPPFTHTGVDTSFGSMGSAVSSSFFGHLDNALSDGVSTLAPNQFAIFKVDFTLNTAADNSFQGQTFTYSMNAQAKQQNALTF